MRGERTNLKEELKQVKWAVEQWLASTKVRGCYLAPLGLDLARYRSVPEKETSLLNLYSAPKHV